MKPTGFIDANIFIYAMGKEHAFKKVCMYFLERLAEKDESLACNVEILQEILFFYQKRQMMSDGIRLLDLVQKIVPVIYPIQTRDLIYARDLLKTYKDIPVRDCIHASTMHYYGLNIIYSFDKDFDRLPGIRRIEPK